MAFFSTSCSDESSGSVRDAGTFIDAHSTDVSGLDSSGIPLDSAAEDATEAEPEKPLWEFDSEDNLRVSKSSSSGGGVLQSVTLTLRYESEESPDCVRLFLSRAGATDSLEPFPDIDIELYEVQLLGLDDIGTPEACNRTPSPFESVSTAEGVIEISQSAIALDIYVTRDNDPYRRRFIVRGTPL